MIDIERIKQSIEPVINDIGYDLIRVLISQGSRPTLQVMIERIDRLSLTIDHCSEVSRKLSSILDAEDPIPRAYILEVSTPGVNRPLVMLKDFQRFIGFQARIQTHHPINGRRRYHGLLQGVTSDSQVILTTSEEQYHIPFVAIHQANLVVIKG